MLKEFLYWDRKKAEFTMQKSKTKSASKDLISDEILFRHMIGTYGFAGIPSDLAYSMGSYVSEIKGQRFMWDYIPFVLNHTDDRVIRLFSPAIADECVYVPCFRESVLLDTIKAHTGCEYGILKSACIDYFNSHHLENGSWVKNN